MFFVFPPPSFPSLRLLRYAGHYRFASLILTLDREKKRKGKGRVVKRNHPVCFSFFFRGIELFSDIPLPSAAIYSAILRTPSNPTPLFGGVAAVGEKRRFPGFCNSPSLFSPFLSAKHRGLSFNSGKGEEGSVDSTILYALRRKEKFSPGCLAGTSSWR